MSRMTSAATSHQLLILLILLYASVDGKRSSNRNEQVTTTTPSLTTQQVKVNDVTSSNVEYGNVTNQSKNGTKNSHSSLFIPVLRAGINEGNTVLDARSLEIIIFGYVCF